MILRLRSGPPAIWLIGFGSRTRDGDAAARMRIDDVDRVLAAQEGEAVPEEGFGG